MKSFNWFNDLSSILTQDLATAAVEETEPESMEFLENELGDKVEKLSQISWKEMFERYVPVVCDYLLRIALVFVIFFVGRKLIKKIVSLCDQALKRHGMEVTVRRFFCIEDAKKGLLSPYWQGYAKREVDSLRLTDGSLPERAEQLYKELKTILLEVHQKKDD